MKRFLALPALVVFAAACGDTAQITQPEAAGSPSFSATAAPALGDVFAYVSNFGSDDVSVINTATNTVVATIPVGDTPQQLAITPDGSEVFVANFNSDDVSVINTATNSVTATVAAGDGPFGVAVTPDGASVWVTNSDNTITVIDAQTMSVDATISLGANRKPVGVAFTSDGVSAYVVIVTASSQGKVVKYNTTTHSVDAEILVGLFPVLVSFSPDGAFAYVANQGTSDDVSKIDVATFTVAATIPIPTPVPGNGAFEVALTPDGTTAYVSNLLDNNVAIINTATDMVTGTISVGTHPQGLKVSADGAFIYVTHFTSDNVYVISTATNALVTIIPVGDTPRGIVLTPGPMDEEGPEATAVAANPNPVAIGTNVDLTAHVDDTNTGSSDIASVEYSLDGGAFTGMVASDGVFDEVAEGVEAAFAAPAEAGVLDLCVQGTDAPGNVGDPVCIMLVVFDPSGGFVTGGGWIDSPAGAYVPDPTLTGKANFGFVSKYKKGANVPTGNTQFQFRTGDLNFHSTSYDWLVVTGSNYARFKGSGTINGMGDYRFMLWAGDNDPDTFRIKITEIGGGIVYDNGSDQPIGGGSIKIHRR